MVKAMIMKQLSWPSPKEMKKGWELPYLYVVVAKRREVEVKNPTGIKERYDWDFFHYYPATTSTWRRKIPIYSTIWK